MPACIRSPAEGQHSAAPRPSPAPPTAPLPRKEALWLLLQRAASQRRADFLSPPRETADQDSVLSPTPEPLGPAREMLRWLEQATTPERCRLWLAREVEDLPLTEIARQEGCSPARAGRVLERARADLQTAFAREASSRLGTFAPRPANPPST